MPFRTSHRSPIAACPFVGVAAWLFALTACLSGSSGYVHADDKPLAPGDVILLDFGASWCGPCRQMQPVIGDLSRSGWLVRHVDVDVEPDLVRRFGITGVPCYVLLVRGEEKGRIGGVTTRSALESLMRRSMPTASEPLAAANTSAAVPEVAIPGVPLAATPVARALVTEPSLPGEGRSNRPPMEPASIVNAQASPQRGPVANTRPSNESVATLVDDQNARRLLATSARLRVEDGKGASWGTGTVIDCRQGEALILTCGHIFRDSAGGGRVEVDLFGSPDARGLSGQVISWNLERDLALVSVFTDEPVTAARVGGNDRRLSVGESVHTVGCDGGAEPTVHVSRVTTIDKYLGPPNVQVAGQPVQGRSGGGLFASDGTLIGVCQAADPADNEGLFAALSSIHEQLEESGLGFVYRTTYPTAALTPKASDPGLPAMPSQMPAVSLGRRDRAEAVPTSSVALVESDQSTHATSGPPAAKAGIGEDIPRNQAEVDLAPAEQSLTPAERALLDHVRRHGRAAEVICIVRPSDQPQAASEVFVLNSALDEKATDPAGADDLAASDASR